MVSHKTALRSESIGLDPNKIDERKIGERVYQYVARKNPTTGESQAPIPKGTVGPREKLRRDILQLSIFPDIYTKVRKVSRPGNVDFGDAHDEAC